MSNVTRYLVWGAVTACAVTPEPDKPVDTDVPAVDTDADIPVDPPDTDIDPVFDTERIDADEDGSPASLDCDDDDPDRRPGVPDVCDGRDNDCDDEVDEDPETWFTDGDGDGYGSTGEATCTPQPGAVQLGGDCDDANPLVNPGTPERCNDLNDDCDRNTSQDGLATFWAQDGTITDMTAMLTGTATTPADVTLTDPGTLEICHGTWFVRLELTGRTDIRGRGGPVLDGANTWRPMTVRAGASPFLRDFTLARGLAEPNASGQRRGGNLLVEGAFVLGSNLTLDLGEAEEGGGAYVDGMMLDIANLVVTANTASVRGGGVVLANGAGLTMSGGVMQGNAAPRGAALDVDARGSAFLSGVLVADHSGVAVALTEDADLTCFGQALQQLGIVRTNGVAVRVGTGSRLNLRDCDFGVGGDANTVDLALEGTAGVLADLGDDVDRVCTGAGCG